MSTAAPTTVPPSTGVPTTLAPTTPAPSTAVPTTVVPTTVASSTPVPTTLVPTTIPPTPWPGWVIDAGAIEIEIALVCWFHYYPAAVRDSTLDAWLSVDSIEVELEITGEQLNQWIEAGTIDIEIEISYESYVIGLVISDCTIELEVVLVTYGFVLDTSRTGWVKWSKVGYLDFTLDESNVAGERPLDWKGYIYHIKKLGNKIVIYGQNGVTFFIPQGTAYGMETIYRLGVKNKGAMVGKDNVHFFIDQIGQLWKLDDKLTKLDYSEYLAPMTDIVMSYDLEKDLIYICDGTTGYVYSVGTRSFGRGPSNITGIGNQSGNIYAVSEGEIVTPKFEICTDVYDFGTRKAKTVYSIEVGSDLTENLHASVDYRTSYKDSFRQIDWFLVNPDGHAFPKCYGVEFRFRLRSFMYEYFEIDYLKIGGMIHDFSYLDTTARESQRIAAGSE